MDSYYETVVDYSSLVAGTSTLEDLLTIFANEVSANTGDTFVVKELYGRGVIEFPDYFSNTEASIKIGLFVIRSNATSSYIVNNVPLSYVLQSRELYTFRIYYSNVNSNSFVDMGVITMGAYGDKGTWMAYNPGYYASRFSGADPRSSSLISLASQSYYKVFCFYLDKSKIQSHGFYSVALCNSNYISNDTRPPANAVHNAFITLATKSSGDVNDIIILHRFPSGRLFFATPDSPSVIRPIYPEEFNSIQESDKGFSFMRMIINDYKINSFYYMCKSKDEIGSYIDYHNMERGEDSQSLVSKYMWKYGLDLGAKKYYLLISDGALATLAIEKKD